MGNDRGDESCRAARLYRDDAAQNLGVDPKAVTLIPWEYEVDVRQNSFAEANIGFIKARSAVYINPQPSAWERDHQHLAGLFDLATFDDLTQLELAVGFDATSEISVFGVVDGDARSLGERLASPGPPRLSSVLGEHDVFADLSVTRDRFPGTHSYVAFASRQDLTAPLVSKVEHFEAQWAAYCAEYARFQTLHDFVAGAERLLRMPAE